MRRVLCAIARHAPRLFGLMVAASLAAREVRYRDSTTRPPSMTGALGGKNAAENGKGSNDDA